MWHQREVNLVTRRNLRGINAYHEAGHAVLALACGFSLISISIEEKEGRLGRVEFVMPSEPLTELEYRKLALIAMGGIAGDLLHWRMVEGDEEAPEGYFSDFGKAKAHLRNIGEEEYIQSYIGAAALVLEKEDRWGIVVELAGLLLKCSYIDGQVIFKRMLSLCPTVTELEWEALGADIKEAKITGGLRVS
jgi:hypothetical protein